MCWNWSAFPWGFQKGIALVHIGSYWTFFSGLTPFPFPDDKVSDVFLVTLNSCASGGRDHILPILLSWLCKPSFTKYPCLTKISSLSTWKSSGRCTYVSDKHQLSSKFHMLSFYLVTQIQLYCRLLIALDNTFCTNNQLLLFRTT